MSSILSSIHQGDHLRIGHLELKRPDKINALNLSMVEDLYEILNQWKSSQSVDVVVLTGNGPKGFCAGGDVVEVCLSLSNLDQVNFFRKEYQLDYLIHTYPLPIISVAHGLLFGGGFGLWIGASYRVCTDSTVFSMPESQIGFFPDVGAMLPLNSLGPLGRFLALTGQRLQSQDLFNLGLAKYLISDDARKDVLSCLLGMRSIDEISTTLISLERAQRRTPQSNLEGLDWEELAYLMRSPNFEQVSEDISVHETEHPFLRGGLALFESGSKCSQEITDYYFSCAKYFSLKETFEIDFKLAKWFLNHSHFKQGVKQKLVDKQTRVHWSTLEKTSIKSFLKSTFGSQNHSLFDLP